MDNIHCEMCSLFTVNVIPSLTCAKEMVNKLDKTGKLMRFLTSNRLRKNLEKVNLDLHKGKEHHSMTCPDIEVFVEAILKVESRADDANKALNTIESSPQFRDIPRNRVTANLARGTDFLIISHDLLVNSTTALALAPKEPPTLTRSQTISVGVSSSAKHEEALISDNYASFMRAATVPPTSSSPKTNAGKDDWDNEFGAEHQLVPWDKFIEFATKHFVLPPVNAEEQLILRYVLGTEFSCIAKWISSFPKEIELDFAIQESDFRSQRIALDFAI